MIRMTRLRLINWHNFQDDLIEFKNITYLLGVNAVGKTTIMDAVRYCLTTNKDFNTAGNKKSGRTLLGSVHQKQRAEDSYLRPGHTVSYIGIEFLDENIDKNFVITVRVESETPKQDLKGVYQDWYITKAGYTLEDIPFFVQVKDGKRPASREAFKLDNKGMDRASNQADARRRICRMLGIGDADSPIGKKFNEVFHMGTSLEDIKDIREFIYTYILPEPEVNIDFLQKDMRELERLQEVLQEAKDREELLAEINEKIVAANLRLSKVKVNEMLIAYAEYQGNQEERQEKENLISEWTATVSILTEKLTELAEKDRKAEDLLYEARKAAENNTDNKEMLSLEQENRNNELEHEGLLRDVAVFTESAAALSSLQKSLNEIGYSCAWGTAIESEEAPLEERQREINLASKELKDLEETLKNHEFELQSRIKTLTDQAAALEMKIKSLQSGVMLYPPEATLVRDKINEELRDQNKSEDAKLLCELLYMTDDSWQDAVESYLNTQRFHIIVSPDYYLLAKKVFISLGDKVKGIGLIDTRKIPDRRGNETENQIEKRNVSGRENQAVDTDRFIIGDKVSELYDIQADIKSTDDMRDRDSANAVPMSRNSADDIYKDKNEYANGKSTKIRYLADQVTSENVYARRYIHYVCRDVVCCETTETLEQHAKSVTKDRLRYQNYCLQRMRKQEHFIGIDAIEKQLKTAGKELTEIQKTLGISQTDKKVFDAVLDSYTRFMAGNRFSLLEKYLDAGVRAKELGVRIDEIRQKIEEFKRNPILLAMYNRVAECEKNAASVKEEITDLKAKKQNLEASLTRAEESVKELESAIPALRTAYEDILSEYPEHASDVEQKYQEERKTKKAAQVAQNFKNLMPRYENELNHYVYQELIPLQQKYTATYTCDYPEGIAGATRYQQEYLALQNIELERHKEELAQAQIRCKDRFRKEVLFRMKDDILRARQQFKQINRVMENLEYGEESYRFGIDKSRDKELGLFYDIIMDKDNMQIDRDNEIQAYLAEMNRSELFESQIEDFMSRIMLDVEEHAKENLTGKKTDSKSMGLYVDYRTYLDYDIIVKNSVTENEVPLSKVSGEGSGGENQAPFYVAICASLLQIYEQNPDGCMRLILLDEAFNNMTSDRIEPMMNMFKKLNLQLVLIATAEKATSILPYCDITYSIVKSGNRNAIGIFEKV